MTVDPGSDPDPGPDLDTDPDTDPGPAVGTGDLETVAFATPAQLWAWLEEHHADHPGVWVRLPRTRSPVPSVSFTDLLEAGLAHGWSESTRRRGDATSYLQRFTPRRTRGTTSARNLAIAQRLEADGRMTPAGRRALGR